MAAAVVPTIDAERDKMAIQEWTVSPSLSYNFRVLLLDFAHNFIKDLNANHRLFLFGNVHEIARLYTAPKQFI
jgi:hypothetical protein